ncbi:MAG: alpha-N-arabinofuranosidase [Acidobacteriaceae bacterium]|nr:alpha-N-arabinofuranosidase [Acidobacteriaceae bacterium]
MKIITSGLARLRTRSLLLSLLLTGTTAIGQNKATLTIDLQHPKGKVSPTLYGLMTEEINYSYEGGLYAQLIRTPQFVSGWDQPAHWFLTPRGNAQLSFQLDKTVYRSRDRMLSLRVDIKQADTINVAALGNEGYWGIPAKPSTTYRATIYAKGHGIGPMTASIVNDDTGQTFATATGEPIEDNWREYDVQLTTGPDVPISTSNRFVLSFQHPGTVWLDYVSLRPTAYHNRANGTRVDLMEKMAAMKPAFLRFPGGNYVEGNEISERFDWKKTVGNPADRPGHLSPWGYPSSDGFGLLEFLEWCEDLNMQPVLAVYAGYSLRGEHVEPGTALDPYVNDALDEIEYVTGDSATKWGGQRARDGHPHPFPLHYVEIGNEDFFDKSGSYDGRFAQFYKAIKAKHPKLELIATAKVKGTTPDVLDEHYYRHADEMFANAGQYDKADRSGPKIFVGEWATREGTPTPDMYAALGDAAWMTGIERNSDLIVMSCYAPLFVNVKPGGMQWATDLIGYDALRSYGSPSYYAQVLFSNHHGDEILNGKLESDDPRVFYSATRDSKSGTLYLKIVNASTAPLAIRIKPGSGSRMSKAAEIWTLKGASAAQTNSIDKPEEIKPSEYQIKNLDPNEIQQFAPLSINVLEIPAAPQG